MILSRYFEGRKTGFFVDIGAHHPLRFSNTHLFYTRGWKGINIDAMPGSMALFKRMRKRDINMEIGIAKEDGVRKFYVFNDPAMNGFSAELSQSRDATDPRHHIVEVIDVQVMPLSSLLGRLSSSFTRIDFMSVDVEGLDLEVLQSNDWGLYRPELLLVEAYLDDIDGLESDPVAQYIRSQGYRVFAKTVNTVFFRDSHLRN